MEILVLLQTGIVRRWFERIEIGLFHGHDYPEIWRERESVLAFDDGGVEDDVEHLADGAQIDLECTFWTFEDGEK